MIKDVTARTQTVRCSAVSMYVTRTTNVRQRNFSVGHVNVVKLVVNHFVTVFRVCRCRNATVPTLLERVLGVASHVEP